MKIPIEDLLEGNYMKYIDGFQWVLPRLRGYHVLRPPSKVLDKQHWTLYNTRETEKAVVVSTLDKAELCYHIFAVGIGERGLVP